MYFVFLLICLFVDCGLPIWAG